MKQENKGITLIALVITIIVLLILAAVSIATLTGENGILTKAKEAKTQNTKSQAEEEAKLAVASLIAEETTTQMTQEEKRQFLNNELKQYDSSSTVENDGTGFLANHRGYEVEIDDKYQVSVKEPFNAEEWDKTATPDNVFIWQSNDSTEEGYGVVIGYTANVQNYTTLKYPSRCTKIEFSNNLNYNGINTLTSRAFTNNILEVQIPETVTEIGGSAFGGMISSFKSMKKIDIPDSVTNIGPECFKGTEWLESQPEGLVYAGKVLYCYKGTMESNTKIELKEGTKGIAGWAFEGCKGLTSVTIPNSVENIGYMAFARCTGLVNITIPNSVTEIGNSAFNLCEGLTSVTISNGVTIIESNAFGGCSNLKEIIIPNSVIDLQGGAFCFCSNLENITIPESVNNIEENAFFASSDTLIYNVVKGSYADTWVQANKYGNQTINYITQ